MKYWHDLEKTIEAKRGMSVAVVEGVAISNGQPLDAVQPDPKLRPTVDIFGYLDYAPRRYMDQIMAECDCSRQEECEATQRCIAAFVDAVEDYLDVDPDTVVGNKALGLLQAYIATIRANIESKDRQ